MTVQDVAAAIDTRNRHERRGLAAHGAKPVRGTIGDNGAPSLEPTEPPLWLTVNGFCKPRALPRSTFYKMVAANQIRICKRGRRSLIHHAEAERFDNSLLDAAA